MTPPGLTLRAETPADSAAIHDLTRRAFAPMRFSQGDEADLVDRLRDAGALTLSLVAVQAGRIVGHVAFSPAVAADGSTGWYALGPISVEPALQRQGIGGALIRAGLAALGPRNPRGCILIGETGYYPRHGFTPRPDLAPEGEPAAHFMVLPLDGLHPRTIVGFHPIFHAAGTPT